MDNFDYSKKLGGAKQSVFVSVFIFDRQYQEWML